MIKVYFKSKGNLICVEVETDNFSLAQVDAQMFATKNGYTPDSPVLAVIDGGKK